MPIPWPKILTAVTVPSGGWDLDFIISDPGSLDTPLTATIAAGTYFLAWDYQDDCLLFALNKAMYDALVAAGVPNDQRPVNVYLDSDNKVNIHFSGDGYAGAQNDVELTFSTSESDLIAALGFDSSSDPQSTADDNPTFTGTYQAGYSWYAAEDGQLISLLAEDNRITKTSQSISYAGNVASQQIGERYVNELQLDWLSRAQTFSRGVAYGSQAVNPYQRNEALECWWNEAAQGTRFRVYRDGRNRYTDGAIDRGTATGSSTFQLSDTGKNWDTDPDEHTGRTFETTHETTDTVSTPCRVLITGINGGTGLTATNGSIAGGLARFAGGGINYWVLDQRYETYVLDVERMKRFAPEERPQIDRYKINIPLLRYEA